MSLAIRGNDFNFFFSTNKPKIELADRKWTTIIDTFCPVGTRVLANLKLEAGILKVYLHLKFFSGVKLIFEKVFFKVFSYRVELFFEKKNVPTSQK